MWENREMQIIILKFVQIFMTNSPKSKDIQFKMI